MSQPCPDVSIGLAVYNAENYLAAAIESWLGQTYGNFELVISDNASTDATADICHGFATRDGRVRYHRAERNRGLAWNFNRAFELARGELFCWAAHDDLRAPTYLARCVEVLLRDRNLVLCHSETAEISADGQHLADASPHADSRSSALDPSHVRQRDRADSLSSRDSWRRLAGVLLYTTMAHEVYGLVRADALRKTRGLLPFFGSDMVLLAELSVLGPCHILPETLFFSRRHEHQASSMATPQGRQTLIDGRRARRFAIPRKVRYPWEVFRAIVRSELSLVERLRCLAVLSRFGAQGQKWKRLFVELAGRWPPRGTALAGTKASATALMLAESCGHGTRKL